MCKMDVTQIYKVTKNPYIRSWIVAKLDVKDYTRIARRKLDDAKRKAKFPKEVRPCLSDDIKVGAIIWYKHGDDGPFWMMVEEVLAPNDLYKGYEAEDGCRYGLDDAWVEVVK